MHWVAWNCRRHAAGVARFGSGIRPGRDVDGQGNAGAFRGVVDWRRKGAEVEAERKFLFAGGGGPACSVGEPHAAAFAGAIFGRGGREDGIAEPRSVY